MGRSQPGADVGIGWLGQQASPAMRALWGERYNVRVERQLWLAVLDRHIRHGVAPSWAFGRYASARHHVDLDSITARERVTRHDVKARIEEYNHLAGGIEYIHLGMTSADVVDNVAQIRLRRSLTLLCDHPVAADRLAHLLDRYPMRGIKGAIGTMQDQIDLIGIDGARALDEHVARLFGFNRVLECVGQTYHRSLDLEMLAPLAGLPIHDPWSSLVIGYVQMTADYSGSQWNEGDVSTSSVRRVALPGALLAAEIGLTELEKAHGS